MIQQGYNTSKSKSTAPICSATELCRDTQNKLSREQMKLLDDSRKYQWMLVDCAAGERILWKAKTLSKMYCLGNANTIVG